MDMQRRCGPEVKSGNAQEMSSQRGGKGLRFHAGERVGSIRNPSGFLEV